MLTVTEMYKGNFFSKRHKLSWRVPYVCDAICKVLNPKSIIDVGCATGDYVQGFIQRGVDAKGIEGSKNCLPYLVAPEDKVIIYDIRNLIEDVGIYDLVICLEVLEHIEPEFADAICWNLTQLSDHILVSAATPGQRGHYHINCQDKQYWVEKFRKHGYERDINIEALILKEWEPVKSKKEMSAYYNNLLFFR